MSVAFCQEKKRADTGYCSRMCRLQLNRIDLIVWLRRSVALVQSDTDATISAEAICRSCCPGAIEATTSIATSTVRRRRQPGWCDAIVKIPPRRGVDHGKIAVAPDHQRQRGHQPCSVIRQHQSPPWIVCAHGLLELQCHPHEQSIRAA